MVIRIINWEELIVACQGESKPGLVAPYEGYGLEMEGGIIPLGHHVTFPGMPYFCAVFFN